jgi:hypothetical protein
VRERSITKVHVIKERYVCKGDVRVNLHISFFFMSKCTKKRLKRKWGTGLFIQMPIRKASGLFYITHNFFCTQCFASDDIMGYKEQLLGIYKQK